MTNKKVEPRKIRKYRRPYHENSRISKTLDVLALEGIDCVRIGQRVDNKDRYKPGPKTLFLPINMCEDKNFIDDLYKCGGWIVTKDDMEIEVDTMVGYEIKEFKPDWKVKDTKVYDVIKIGYGYTPIDPIKATYSPLDSTWRLFRFPNKAD